VYLGLGLRLGSGTFAATAPAPGPSSLLTGLLAYWKFDNNGSGGVSLFDSTASSRTLSAPNGASGLALGPGIVNGCAVFSADDTTYLSRSGTFLNGSRDEYSISAWVLTYESYIFIANGSTDNNWGGSSIALEFAEGNLMGTVFWGSGPDYDRATGSSVLNDEGWYHVAMTWKRTGSIKVYVNGGLDGSASSSGNYANVQTENISINGNADGTYALGKDGSIDEVAIWNRELSASEITSLYNSGDGKSYPFA